MFEMAEKSSARAAELVGQLLTYAGKARFVITRFDFSALISEMLPLIAASIPRTVELERLAKGPCDSGPADQGGLRSVTEARPLPSAREWKFGFSGH
jgi:hypothetical protein